MKYVADDGKEFKTEAECIQYENDNLNYHWEIAYISSSANSIDDKSFYRVYAPNIDSSDEVVKLYIEDWCHSMCGGSPLTFVNGIPARKYEVRKISRAEFCDRKLKCEYCKATLVIKRENKRFITLSKF